MQQSIASSPNQEHYTFVLEDPTTVDLARQAVEEVTAALGVRIVLLLWRNQSQAQDGKRTQEDLL